ncbi:transporter substrate-binding domain-containing protein [Lactobacillus salsicarnum]|uniref:Transporter substrate-binding domain-containing protein n=2 Tax=Companilactobacillus mishanensis TaxID=2486008 RepID=A0A5P0ZKM5_9LACO|nr:transporter substrate-binding domain-containing protein [Companilactobacillus mishanensis]MQS89517.1 transporter substrate-binding domain-containing protein [Companilactobacillus mishanensis]
MIKILLYWYWKKEERYMTRVMKKLGLIFATLLLLVSSVPLLNQHSAQAADTTANTDSTIKVGTTQSISSLPFYFAQDKKYYDAHSVKVELQQFKTASELNDAIKAGKVNVAVTDLVNFTTIAKNNKSWKVAGTATGYSALVANKKFKNVKSLKGKTIAIDKKDGSKYYLKNLLSKNDMKMSDVNVKNVANLTTRVSNLKSKKVDAAVLSDPAISNAKQNGAKVLNKQKANNKNGDIIAVSNDLTTSKVSDVNNLINSYNDAAKDLTKSGFVPADVLLLQLGATRKSAAKMNDLDVKFASSKKVKKADFDKAVKYAKSQKLISNTMKYKNEKVNLDKVTK